VDRIVALGELPDLEKSKEMTRPGSHLINQWKALADKISTDPIKFWSTNTTDREAENRMDQGRREKFEHDVLSWASPNRGLESLELLE